jgi:UDP-N-acetylglucosamine--N-acetylmuramyl-(pentapeptide) pyrophosphoryl-undecaprenol N-acetylglucosamine transferase
VLPALAVAEALRGRGVSVSFAGPTRTDPTIVTDAGFELDPFQIEGFPRSLSPRTLSAIMRASAAPFACIRILRRRRPAVVLGAGGYTGGPMVLAASLLRIPAAVMEADAHLGLANRLAAPLAKRVFLAYPLQNRDGKVRVVGRPIPSRSELPPEGPAEARRRFGLPAEGPVVLVCGGSQGARKLNEAAVEAFAHAGPAVLHLTGERDFVELSSRVERPGYRMLPFTNDFGAALAAADLVVSRSGGVVWEIAAAGKPALLVPYPHATADHQTKNAQYFADAGAALLVAEPHLDLAAQASALLADPDRLQAMAEAMRGRARPDAAEVVAEELLTLAATRR